MEKHNEEERPLIEGSDQAAEGSSGNVPGKTAKAKSHATGAHFWFCPTADFDRLYVEQRAHYKLLSSIWFVLLREAHTRRSLTVQLSDEIIAERMGYSKKTRTSIQKIRHIFVEMGLATHEQSEYDPATGKKESTIWHLFPSHHPWSVKNYEKKESRRKSTSRRKKKTPCSQNAEIKLHGSNENPCSQKAALSDENELQTNISFQDSKEILKVDDISEDNGIHHSGGRLEATADDSVTSLRKSKTDAAALPPDLQRLHAKLLAKRARGKGNHEG